MTNERAYTPSLVLHVLRNPHGWSAEAITAARLQAADEIERLRDALKRVRRVAAEGTTHTGMIAALGILVDRALNPGNGPLPPDYTYHSHEPSEQPQYRKWPGEPPHCMSCDCGMTDEQKRTVPEADYLRVHKELMDLKYPQQGASRDASPRSNDWADAKGGLPDNKL